MEQHDSILLGILKRLFGNPKTEFSNQSQFEFNCPSNICRLDRNKFNLNFNLNKKIFHCFKCGYHGIPHILAQDYGTAEDVKRINLLFPTSGRKEYKKLTTDFDENITCELPVDYRPLTQNWNTGYYQKSLDYLKGRRVTDDLIKKYEIGYAEAGDRRYRIIIPSRNKNGDINYYDARSFFKKSKTPYLKPKEPNKLSIIFNEKNINFDLPVYLVEGVFDMFPLPNCVPMLGKDLSQILIYKFIKHKTKVILCLDEDAIADSIRIYTELNSYGVDVYFVEVKDDIAKYYELYGKNKLIKMIRTYKKLDFAYLYNLKLNSKKSKNKFNKEQLEEEISIYKKQIKEDGE